MMRLRLRWGVRRGRWLGLVIGLLVLALGSVSCSGVGGKVARDLRVVLWQNMRSGMTNVEWPAYGVQGPYENAMVINHTAVPWGSNYYDGVTQVLWKFQTRTVYEEGNYIDLIDDAGTLIHRYNGAGDSTSFLNTRTIDVTASMPNVAATNVKIRIHFRQPHMGTATATGDSFELYDPNANFDSGLVGRTVSVSGTSSTTVTAFVSSTRLTCQHGRFNINRDYHIVYRENSSIIASRLEITQQNATKSRIQHFLGHAVPNAQSLYHTESGYPDGSPPPWGEYDIWGSYSGLSTYKQSDNHVGDRVAWKYISNNWQVSSVTFRSLISFGNDYHPDPWPDGTYVEIFAALMKGSTATVVSGSEISASGTWGYSWQETSIPITNFNDGEWYYLVVALDSDYPDEAFGSVWSPSLYFDVQTTDPYEVYQFVPLVWSSTTMGPFSRDLSIVNAEFSDLSEIRFVVIDSDGAGRTVKLKDADELDVYAFNTQLEGDGIEIPYHSSPPEVWDALLLRTEAITLIDGVYHWPYGNEGSEAPITSTNLIFVVGLVQPEEAIAGILYQIDSNLRNASAQISSVGYTTLLSIPAPESPPIRGRILVLESHNARQVAFRITVDDFLVYPPIYLDQLNDLYLNKKLAIRTKAGFVKGLLVEAKVEEGWGEEPGS